MDDGVRAAERRLASEPMADNARALRVARRRAGLAINVDARLRLDGALLNATSAHAVHGCGIDPTGNWRVLAITGIETGDARVLLGPIYEVSYMHGTPAPGDEYGFRGVDRGQWREPITLHESDVLEMQVVRDVPLRRQCLRCYVTGSRPCQDTRGKVLKRHHVDRGLVVEPLTASVDELVQVTDSRDPEPPALLDDVKVIESRKRDAEIKLARRDTLVIRTARRVAPEARDLGINIAKRGVITET